MKKLKKELEEGEIDKDVQSKYIFKGKLGEGAYGHVWLVRDKNGTKELALKKIFGAFRNVTDAQRTYREVVSLINLNHKNIVKLKKVMMTKNSELDCYLVFEIMESDLHKAILKGVLQDVHHTYITHQLVLSVKYLHESGLLHRDIKPANLLLNSRCEMKLADFGLSRFVDLENNDKKPKKDIQMTNLVATRWYRAPEIIFKSSKYSGSMDMWSVGCVIGEMLLGRPMFPGDSPIGQLLLYRKYIGPLTKEDLQSFQANDAVVVKTLEELNKKAFLKPSSLDELFPKEVNRIAVDFVKGLIKYNPKKRMTPAECLKHPFLKEFNMKNPPNPNDKGEKINIRLSDDVKHNIKKYKSEIIKEIQRRKERTLRKRKKRKQGIKNGKKL